MELVRQECGQLLTVVIQWGKNARFSVQAAYYMLYKFIHCEMRYRLRDWKYKMKKKTLVFSGSLIKNSVAVKMLDLVEKGSSIVEALLGTW